MKPDITEIEQAEEKYARGLQFLASPNTPRPDLAVLCFELACRQNPDHAEARAALDRLKETRPELFSNPQQTSTSPLNNDDSRKRSHNSEGTLLNKPYLPAKKHRRVPAMPSPSTHPYSTKIHIGIHDVIFPNSLN